LAIFYCNLHYTDDEPQTATLVLWRHNISTVLTFQCSAIQKVWCVTRGSTAGIAAVPGTHYFNSDVAKKVLFIFTAFFCFSPHLRAHSVLCLFLVYIIGNKILFY
jgi:hypothetical protein